MLAKEQIECLFKFCQKHLVHFYEVQVVLADRLATGIEAQMRVDHKLTFEDALEKEYSKFGVMGFATIVQENRSRLQNKTLRDFLRLVLDQFHWPAVLTFLLVSSASYTVWYWNHTVAMILTGFVLLFGAVREVVLFKKSSKYFKKTGKKFLLLQYYIPAGFVWTYIYFYFIINPTFNGWYDITTSPLFMGIFTAVSVVYMVAANQLYKQLQERLKTEYPELFGK